MEPRSAALSPSPDLATQARARVASTVEEMLEGRTRKVRRRFIAEKYQTLIEALYGGKDNVDVEAKITYEDGRTATMKANLQIRDVETY